MTGPVLMNPVLQQELRAAMERVERRGYVQGWGYGLVCGLITGSSTVGLGVWLAQTVAAAWVR